MSANGAFFSRPRFEFPLGGRTIPLGEKTIVLAILNCTPDSFSDGGRAYASLDAMHRMEQILEEGADWVDIGGESTRPGAEPVDAAEEWRRIGPVFREARRNNYPLLLSVDTTKAEVAARALDEGAALVNDVSGLRYDPAMASVVSKTGAALAVMHMSGEPRTMQRNPVYEDVVREVSAALAESVALAEANGIPREKICVDPGIGFGKNDAHNFALLRGLPQLARLGQPILIGVSRKSFLGRLLGLEVEERLEGSLAANVAAVLAGAHVVRVHDVRATVRAVRVADALLAQSVGLGH